MICKSLINVLSRREGGDNGLKIILPPKFFRDSLSPYVVLKALMVILKIYWVVQKDKIFLLSFMIILFIINGDTIKKSPIDLLN